MSLRKTKNVPNIIENVSSHNEKTKDPDFVYRESPLTVLFEQSLHIQAIYHIFVVILLILLCDTVIYDLIETGKINIGVSSVVYGFGDISRGARLWLFQLAIVLIFYPGIRLYAAVRKIIKDNTVLCKIWSIVGITGVVLLELLLIGVPVWDLAKEHLALGSSTVVTCEMFRFAMKMCSVAVALAERCNNGIKPVPSFSHYVYFLFAPTLIYKDVYPRTKKVRWGVVVGHLLEVSAIIFYNSFLWERFILPYWSNYGKEPTVEAGLVVRGMFACILPGVISFLCGFYLLLHAWHNAFAEMLTFGDRLFYEDWWTTSRFSNYYRAWNRVVHAWLRTHIYQPLAPRAGRAISTFIVFFVSSIAHEVILILSFGFFYPVLVVEFGVFGVLMLPLTASGRRFPRLYNLLMWLVLFIGNGLLWSLYAMEYFARKNCPKLETDNFFVPKSWSCPEVVLKPNWAFQNPFNIIF
ncbi:sterol o-acyltransferase [Danaus plexippus plexippus]|uniref:O-acyltransferase n=1 Tax=Danaus plexippus plexippus TaxID=278856 RepID=A0A212EPX6_DANPL|nr:sterol o-acyltransferase [Danaus plexippus plexippus]